MVLGITLLGIANNVLPKRTIESGDRTIKAEGFQDLRLGETIIPALAIDSCAYS